MLEIFIKHLNALNSILNVSWKRYFLLLAYSFRRTQYKFNQIFLHSVQDRQNAHPTVHRKIIGRTFYIKSAIGIISLFYKRNRDWCSRSWSLKEIKMWIVLQWNFVAYRISRMSAMLQVTSLTYFLTGFNEHLILSGLLKFVPS